MVVAVTGGTGFIGKRLVSALVAAGHEVRVLTRKSIDSADSFSNVRYYQGDLAGAPDFSDWLSGVDVLFHCAGELSNPSRMEELHVKGTQRLAVAAAGKIGRWVQLSSTGAYGSRRSGQVLESDALNPVGPYETTKAMSDEVVIRAAGQGAFDHVILRPSIVYGAGMPNQSLYAMLRMIERGLFFFIGRPGASANYIHVDNVVKALIDCGFKDEACGQTFNISDYCTMERFVEMMALELGVRAPVWRLPEWPVRRAANLLESIHGWPLKASRVDALTSFATYPTGKIEQRLQYAHLRSMSDGIADLVRSYRSHAS